MGLRKGQKELVEKYTGGYCAVPAIPGGGKTYSLTQWAAGIIEKGLHRPGKLLIVTYMNSAVNNFKQRISKELQLRGIRAGRAYSVSTIHGLCLQVIKEKPDLVIADQEFKVIDELSKVRLISSCIDEWRRHNEKSFMFFVDTENMSSGKLEQICKKWHEKLERVVNSAIGDFKLKGINAPAAEKLCSSITGNSLLKCCVQIYRIYDRKLKMAGFLDFDDMLFNAKRMLEEDKVLLEKYRKKYTFVCEDEAQDSNRIQNDILTLIAGGNLLRVGDSNQAICGTFTSSDFRLFKDFCENDNTVVYNITQSGRSSKDIIDFANHFVDYITDGHPVEKCRNSLIKQYIEPVGKDDPYANPRTMEYGVKAKVFSSWKEEAAAVVKQAIYTLKKNPDKTIAILAPALWQNSYIAGLLELKGIPFEQLDNTSSERNRAIRILGRVIDYISSPYNGEKLYEMLLECFIKRSGKNKTGMDEKKAGKQVKELKILEEYLSKCHVEKIIYPVGGQIDYDKIPDELLKCEIWEFFTEKIGLIKDFLEFPQTVVEKLVLYISEKLKFDKEERAVAQKVAGDVRYLMSQNPRWRLSDLAFELLSPKNTFNYFAGIVWELKGYEPKPGIITLCTYHKAKGLEWDAVFLTSLTYSDFPVNLSDKFIGEYWFLKPDYRNPNAIYKHELENKLTGEMVENYVLESKIETISEKARLLYVGITRAKEYLYLSGFHAHPGKRNEILPSKYLVELKKYIERAEARKRI